VVRSFTVTGISVEAAVYVTLLASVTSKDSRRPVAERPPAVVPINPDHANPAASLLAKTSALRRQPTQDDPSLPEVVM
jgi:hypothetical protein